MLSGRGLCDELITHPEESYRLWCVVVCDLESSRIGAPYIYIYDISNLRVNARHSCNGPKALGYLLYSISLRPISEFSLADDISMPSTWI